MSMFSICVVVMITEKLDKSRVKATFDVTVEEFAKAVDQAFEKVNATVTIKGFRKGHAPRSVYEKNYGTGALYEEAINIVLNSKIGEIFKDEELGKTVCGNYVPEVGEDFAPDKDFKVSLTFDVLPQFNLPTYKGIEVKKAVLEATPEEVQASIDAILTSHSTKAEKKEQVISNLDIAVFDFVGSVDGVEFEGGSAKDYELKIGSGQFIPGFEDQMIGMKAGETKDVNVTFPENYGAENLAGKPAIFKVTVHSVKEEILPELTDDFVAGLKMDGVNTVEELKANKKASLEAGKATSEKDRQVDELINKILDNTVCDMPQSLIDERVQGIRSQYENQAKAYNIPFETFLGLMNITKEKFDEETEKQGARQALFSQVFAKIIEAEKLAPSAEEISEFASKQAKNGEKVEDLVKNNGVQYFNQMAYDKLIQFLLDNAKYVD